MPAGCCCNMGVFGLCCKGFCQPGLNDDMLLGSTPVLTVFYYLVIILVYTLKGEVNGI
jgi:hypothetical protein